jgi:hypothetical protein
MKNHIRNDFKRMWTPNLGVDPFTFVAFCSVHFNSEACQAVCDHCKKCECLLQNYRPASCLNKPGNFYKHLKQWHKFLCNGS